MSMANYRVLFKGLFYVFVLVLSGCGVVQINEWINIDNRTEKVEMTSPAPPYVHTRKVKELQPIGKKCVNVSTISLLGLDTKKLQTFKFTDSKKMFLSSAYLDKRPTLPTRKVRVFAVTQRRKIQEAQGHLHCLIWYNNQIVPVISKADIVKMWGYECPYHTAMISCSVSDDYEPKFVSIASNCSTPQNIVEILRSPEDVQLEKDKVAVCTKVLYGQPNPIRLAEWIEMLHILGASNIYLYNASVRGEANKVLEHYQHKKKITVVRHNFVKDVMQYLWKSGFPTASYNQNWELEILSMNDCLYRAHEKYLVNIDIDEILHMKQDYQTYMTKTAEMKIPTAASLVFKTGVYSDELGANTNLSIPRYLHLMTHDKRTVIDPESPKSVLRRHHCLISGHHVCLTAVKSFPARFYVDATEGHLHHYREHCRLTGEKNKCTRLLRHPVVDRSLHKYMQELDSRVKKVIEKLRL